MSTTLLATKLCAPTLRAELVPRPRLMARLTEGLACRLTLVSAPAGFGKTTLIAAWLRDAGRPYGWLSLDEADNDPSRFTAYLLAALQRIDPNIGQAAQAMMQVPQPPAFEALLTSLINDIAATPKPFILVLDDYQLVQAPPIHPQIGFLLEHQPPQMHLVISTREDPPLALSRLRARRQMADIRQRDLQFTLEETTEFLARMMGLDVPADAITALQQRTEGWVAGLQLAALSMQQSDDIRQFVADFAGSHRYILDYLVEEVFQRQAPQVQDFLCKTSILNRLTAPLCDAVTERNDSRQMLLALDQAHLFIVRLDESRQWYRYHRLFRDLLRMQSAGLDAAALHARAARWYEDNGFLDEAVEHVLAAEDWPGAERLIAPAAAQAIKNGQFATLNRWLDALPAPLVGQRSAFATLKAWAALSMGQLETAEACADLAESLLPAGAAPPERGVLIALRTYLSLARRDAVKTIQLASDASQLLAKSDPYFAHGAVLSNLAQAQVLAGDIAAATRTYRELLKQSRGVHPLSMVSAMGHLADSLDIQGEREEAIALCQQALDQCVDAHGRPLPPAGLAHILLGRMCYEGNDLVAARQHLLQGLELVEPLGPASGTLGGMIEMARLQLATGDETAALATLDQVRHSALQFRWPQPDALVKAVEAEFALRLGNIAAVERWAESAGLSPANQPDHVQEAEYLTFARLLLMQGRWEEAQVLLDNLQRFAQGGGRRRTLITVQILQALLRLGVGERKAALAHLGEAVRLAASQGYRRAFLDEGPGVLALLSGVRHAAPVFVDGLLGGAPAEPGHSRPPRTGQHLAESLSEREMEVLALVADGLSNQEIAARLFISLGTVKTHVHNICAKLDAGSRTQATAQARKLGLL